MEQTFLPVSLYSERVGKPARSGYFSMNFKKMSLATGPAVEPPW